MRIGYLTGEYPRATDTFIQREVAALRDRDFDVETFSVRRPGPEHLTGPEQEHGQATTTYLLELARTAAFPAALARMVGTRPAAVLRAARLAWRTRRPGVHGTVYQLLYLVEAVLLADQLRRRNVEHLHNHFGDSSCTVAMLASEIGAVPHSFTLHGSGIFFEAKTWRLDAKLDRAMFCACISHYTRSQGAIFAAADTVDRMHIVHCGVEPQRLTPITHSGRATRLIFVGRVIEAKGLGVLFESLNLLADVAPDLELTIVGDGPDRGRLEQRARRMGLADRVRFVGSKSQQEVAELLARSQLFVLPSYAEGVPVVVMEALGTGLPVVASFVGGMGELVTDGTSGFLVPPGDPDSLADRIGRLVDDAELRAAMGRAGRARIEADFDSSIEAARLAGLFLAASQGLPSAIRPALPT